MASFESDDRIDRTPVESSFHAGDLPVGTSWQAALGQPEGHEHHPLQQAIDRLEAALAEPASGREPAWQALALRACREVGEALVEHHTPDELPGGLYAETDITRPTLVRRMERCQREHAALVQQVRSIASRLDNPPADQQLDVGEIRRRAAVLLAALKHHLAHEADLIFETFSTDIGTGD
jgi:hypothetical protein